MKINPDHAIAVEAEATALSGIIYHGVLDRVSGTLAPRLFLSDNYAKIYEICTELARVGTLLSPAAVEAHLRAKRLDEHADMISGLVGKCSLPDDGVTAAQTVVAMWEKRGIEAAMKQHREHGQLDRLADDIAKLAKAKPGKVEKRQTNTEDFEVKSIGDLLNDVYNEAQEPKPRHGCPSGHGFVDVMLGGFRRPNIAVFGGMTSFGKSSFAVMATNATAKSGGRVLLVSGEDPARTFGKRIMAARAKVHAISLRNHSFQPDDFRKMTDALATAEKWPFFVNGVGKSAEKLSAFIAKFCKEHDPNLVIVDYLQAFTCEKRCQDRRNEITHIARCFVDAIKNGNAAGLIFSQLKRLAPGQRPTMHDLKESGDVENMAEHVIIGYVEKDEKASEHDEFGLESFKRFALIEKNKDGPRVGAPIALPFDLATACFTPITYNDYQRMREFER